MYFTANVHILRNTGLSHYWIKFFKNLKNQMSNINNVLSKPESEKGALSSRRQPYQREIWTNHFHFNGRIDLRQNYGSINVIRSYENIVGMIQNAPKHLHIRSYPRHIQKYPWLQYSSELKYLLKEDIAT